MATLSGEDEEESSSRSSKVVEVEKGHVPCLTKFQGGILDRSRVDLAKCIEAVVLPRLRDGEEKFLLVGVRLDADDEMSRTPLRTPRARSIL